MLEASFLNLSDRSRPDGPVSVWPAWEVREHESATSWFNVRLAFGDGAQVDVLAVVSEAGVSIEDVRAQPPLSLDDLAVLADWIEEPLFEACGVPAGPSYEPEDGPARRARPSWPRGVEGRWLVAEEYRAAQEEGFDPVLAVMCATGHSRRKSLRLIAGARDEGFLTPRHARR
ncbi:MULTISPECIES: DUF6214 family protein [unclassified Streptomyces]|uniref:DUF6214 family protein n=1 Tax=unclassified Streptomyces TaxID=2593676 RepID=UPI002E823FAB|nr:DUF6214 family protein [Streptomyces sp. NBC_00589]WTI41130.1 DUF6214 family protein [Streptomyces sp. NBC_00775]WUB25186.1 DUF6214 family protein [Streptomyces sp. NBC_00589]